MHSSTQPLRTLLALGTALVLLYITLAFTDAIWPKIFLATAAIIVSGFAVKFELSHPFVWFGLPFLGYAIAAPVLFELHLMAPIFRGVSQATVSRTVDLSLIGWLSFVFGCGPRIERFRFASIAEQLPKFRNGWWPVFLLALVLTFLGAIFTLESGAVTKGALAAQEGIGPRLLIGTGMFTPVFLVAALGFRQRSERIKFFGLILFIVAILILVLLLAGQRSPLFKFAFVAMLFWHLLIRRVTIRSFAIIAILAIALATFMQGYKLYLLSGSVHNTAFSAQAVKNISTENGVRVAVAYYILGSELRSAGQNADIAVEEFPQSRPFLYGETVGWDIARSLVPGIFLGQKQIPSTSVWFNEQFHPALSSKGEGAGFSLVGEGYINGGAVGVVILFFVLGIVIRRLYHWASHRLVGFVTYLSLTPIFIESLRSDLAWPLSQGLKQILLPLLLMWLASEGLKSVAGKRLVYRQPLVRPASRS